VERYASEVSIPFDAAWQYWSPFRVLVARERDWVVSGGSGPRHSRAALQICANFSNFGSWIVLAQRLTIWRVTAGLLADQRKRPQLRIAAIIGFTPMMFITRVRL